MKKIKLSLLILVLCAGAIFASTPKQAHPVPQGIMTDATKGNYDADAVKRHLARFGLTPADRNFADSPLTQAAILDGARMADGTVLTLPDNVNAIPAGRVRRVAGMSASQKAAYPTPAQITGRYVNVYRDYFDWMHKDSLDRTEVLDIKVNADNSVEFDGLLSIGVKACAGNSMMTKVKNVKGTYYPEYGEIWIASDQKIGYYNESDPEEGARLELMASDLSDSWMNYNYNKIIKFKYINGVWVCNTDLNLVAFTADTDPGPLLGSFKTAIAPVLVPANGKVEYSYTDDNKTVNVKADVAYGFTTRNDGSEYMWLTNFNNLGHGYVTEWDVVDDNFALADNQMTYSIQYSPDGSTLYVEDFYLSALFQEPEGISYINQMVAYIGDRQNIPLNAFTDCMGWSAISPANSWFGPKGNPTLTGTWTAPDPKPQDYVTIYTPFFTNYDNTRSMTTPASLTFLADNQVVINGLGGISAKLAEFDPRYSDIRELRGSYDPLTASIIVEGGQTVGYYNGTELKLYSADLKHGRYDLDGGKLVFTRNGDNWVCSSDIYVAGGGKSYAAQVEPMLMKCNATLRCRGYYTDGDKDIQLPVWYTRGEDEDGECLLMSNLLDRAPMGYVTSWTIVGDRAMALNQKAYSVRTADRCDEYYLSSLRADGSFINKVAADISDIAEIRFPADIKGEQFDMWGAFTSNNRDMGHYYSAIISNGDNDCSTPIRTIYMLGEFNNWRPSRAFEVAANSNGIYEMTVSPGVREIKISTTCGADWDAFNQGALCIASGEEVSDPTGSVEYPLASGIGSILLGETTGMWTLYIDLNTMTLRAVNAMTGIEDITAPVQNAEYYNLQGIPVASPTPGIYIMHQGGKAVKVLVK